MNHILTVEMCRTNVEAIKFEMDKICPQEPQALMIRLNDMASLISLAAQTTASLQYHFDTASMNAVQIAKKEGYSPAMAKTYINGYCAEIGSLYKYSERLGAGLVHIIDGVRSILSYCKQENFAANMQRA
jgi:hypothetical protein